MSIPRIWHSCGGVAQLGECLLSMYKALDLIPSQSSQCSGGRGRKIKTSRSFHPLSHSQFEASLGWIYEILFQSHRTLSKYSTFWATIVGSGLECITQGYSAPKLMPFIRIFRTETPQAMRVNEVFWFGEGASWRILSHDVTQGWRSVRETENDA